MIDPTGKAVSGVDFGIRQLERLAAIIFHRNTRIQLSAAGSSG
jgi:hypothetical protein